MFFPSRLRSDRPKLISKMILILSTQQISCINLVKFCKLKYLVLLKAISSNSSKFWDKIEIKILKFLFYQHYKYLANLVKFGNLKYFCTKREIGLNFGTKLRQRFKNSNFIRTTNMLHKW